MTFFNQKEEVIEIEMTPYGKSLFSRGLFKPTYYAFFDDDILYDSQYAGFTETQNDAQTRIKDKTPRDHVQHLFSGVETKVGENLYTYVGPEYPHRQALIDFGCGGVDKRLIPAVPEADRNYAFYAPLGKSDYSSNSMPAWNIKYWEGALSSSVPHAAGPYPAMRIPQLSSSLEYTISFSRQIEKTIESILRQQQAGDHVLAQAGIDTLQQRLAGGGNHLFRVEEKPLLLEVLEENSIYSNKNFDIEVYIVQKVNPASSAAKGSSDSSRERLIPLSFEKRVSNIKNNILLSPDEMPIVDYTFVPSQDASYVENYFDISLDREVPTSVMRKAVKRRSSKGYFIDSTTFRDTQVSSIFQTDIGGGEE